MNLGTKENPLVLKTPPLTSEYTMHKGERDGVEALVCTVGKTVLYYVSTDHKIPFLLPCNKF